MNEGEWEVTWRFEVSEYVGDLGDLARLANYIGDARDFAGHAADRDLAYDIAWDPDFGHYEIVVSVPGIAEEIEPFLHSIRHEEYFDELTLDLPVSMTDEQCAEVVAKYPTLYVITRHGEDINREVAA